MELCTIGAILKQLRKEKKISLADMCKGLCNVAMASRIENGERIPNRKLIEALFGRIGENAPVEKVPTLKSDSERRNLEYEIDSCIGNDNYQIKELLDKYANCKEKMNKLEKQFYNFASALYQHSIEKNPEKFIQKSTEALRITIPNFSPETLPTQKTFTNTELWIMNAISLKYYHELNQKELAFKFMYFIKEYLENNFLTNEQKIGIYSTVLFNLANWARMECNYKEEKELSEQGLKLSVKENGFSLFVYFLMLKGHCTAYLENCNDGIQIILESCKLFECMSRQEEIDYIKDMLKEEFHYDYLENN